MDLYIPALLPVAYLPPVHYFMVMLKAEEVFIEKHETYPKQTYRNRCEIYTANGKLALSIPVIKVNGNHTRTDEVEISDQYNWQILHWRAISSAYANSPFFLYYKDDIEYFYRKKFVSLFDFNISFLKEIMALTGIEKKILFTEKFEKEPAGKADFRNSISPKVPPDDFAFKKYYQSFSEKYGFIPGLSIIDLLFNEGPETINILS